MSKRRIFRADPHAELARSDHPPVLSVNVVKTNLAVWCFGAAARTATAKEKMPSE